MSGKKRTAGNGSQEKNRLFTQANAAWDKGDLRQAFALFMQAAKLGDVSCQLDLGYFFDQGLSVKKDKKKALEWYRRAYRQGDAGAANNIATVYRDLGDTRKMLWWFRRAAAMGDLDVLLDLGKRYEKGLAVSRNPAKAKIFYRRVLANKCATHDDKAEARARLAGLRERPVSRR
jgi:TPR repeat protein